MIKKKRIRRRKYRTKCELAMAYSPGSSYTAASKNLARWIKACTPLYKRLKDIGYNPLSRSLRTEEVGLIIKYLGRPFSEN